MLFAYAIRQHGFRSPDRRFPNPVDAVPRREEPERQIRFLTLKQIDEQLRVLAEYPVIQAMVATYIYAGLRREEALWLTPDDVDLKAGMIRVRQKVVNGESWQPKTRRNRRVPISSTLRSYLEDAQPAEGSVWFFRSPSCPSWRSGTPSSTKFAATMPASAASLRVLTRCCCRARNVHRSSHLPSEHGRRWREQTSRTSRLTQRSTRRRPLP